MNEVTLIYGDVVMSTQSYLLPGEDWNRLVGSKPIGNTVITFKDFENKKDEVERIIH